MPKILGVLAAMLLTAPGMHAQTTASAADAALIANERALYDAVAKADRTAFLSLVHPEGVWATKQGFVPTNLLADGLDAFALTKWDIAKSAGNPAR
jgi:shikimate 5-dehydrogenase